jgi:hypothetical protein
LSSSEALGGVSYNNIFESSITFSWSGAKKGDNNTIKGYFIQYRLSDNGSTWGSWVDYSTQTTTATTYTYTTSSIADTVRRGQYVQFRIKTLGNVNGYDSDYIATDKMRKNSIPSDISSISIAPSTLEYSYGDSITLSWNKPTDIDNNIYKYKIMAYHNAHNETDTFTHLFTQEIIGADNLMYTFDSNNTYYDSIKNNQKICFSIVPIDTFGREAFGLLSSVITRYDITGVAIGINGKWANCQLYHSQFCYEAIPWTSGSLNQNGLVNTSTEYVYTDDFLKTKEVALKRRIDEYDTSHTLHCNCAYYNEAKEFQKLVTAQRLTNAEDALLLDENYEYVRICITSVGQTIPQSDLYKAVTTNILKWVEQKVSAGINNKWIDADDGN